MQVIQARNKVNSHAASGDDERHAINWELDDTLARTLDDVNSFQAKLEVAVSISSYVFGERNTHKRITPKQELALKHVHFCCAAEPSSDQCSCLQ